MFIIPKHFDVLHATTGSFPLLESRKNKLKQTKKHDSKDIQTDLIIYKTEELKETQEK